MCLSEVAGRVLPQSASLAMNSLTATKSYKQPDDMLGLNMQLANNQLHTM